MNKFFQRLSVFLGSRLFFYLVLGVFVLQALWFVFSAAYPMAFDEDFHLGVVRLYAEQWSPFLLQHPPGADQFGAVTRDPSYLFHYLMSFPYRLILQFTHSEALVVVLLRLLNVGLFAWGLVLFRRVLLRTPASPLLANTSLAVFTLIPIVPQLAAHINYDNAVMVLLPLMCLTVFSLVDGFRRRQVDAVALLGLIAVCLVMSVVKYAALPFVIAAVVFLAVMAWRNFRGQVRRAIPSLRKSFDSARRPAKIALLAVCVLGGVLFAQRYVVNMIVYHAPVPDCGQVLTIDQCSAYGPWGRDYWYAQTKTADFEADPLQYMRWWVHGMWYRSFFAVSGPAIDYTNWKPLPAPSYAAAMLLATGLFAVAVQLRRVFRGQAYLIFFAGIIAVYTSILWFDQFGMYEQTAQPVAINGRYLLPVLPLLAVILGRGIGLLLARIPWQYTKTLFAAVVLLFFLHGGGVQTFILRSDNTWYWPSPAIQALNHGVRSILAPIIVEGPK